MSKSLMDILEVRLPKSIANQSQDHLAGAGRQGLEGMALWAGRAAGSVFSIEEAIIPKQRGLRTEHGLAVTVSASELHRINMHLYRNGRRLVAQIHSHPGHAYHSSTDDEYAIATALGSLSLVVPDFAEMPFSLESSAIYRLQPPRWWQLRTRPSWAKVSKRSASSLIRLVD